MPARLPPPTGSADPAFFDDEKTVADAPVPERVRDADTSRHSSLDAVAFERGYAKRKAEEADARTFADGVEAAMAAMRMWFFAHEVPHAQHISDQIEKQIKR